MDVLKLTQSEHVKGKKRRAKRTLLVVPGAGMMVGNSGILATSRRKSWLSFGETDSVYVDETVSAIAKKLAKL